MKNNLDVIAYTTGKTVPSARYRVRQLIPSLNDLGVMVTENCSKSGAYPPRGKVNQVLWSIENITENFFKVLNQPDCDLIWLQKPFFSKFYTSERFLKKPFVFDVDDAIFLSSNNRFASKIAKRSNRVICGNSYLANYFEKFNSNIDIIPTAVDVSKYDSINKLKDPNVFQILWTGTSSNYQFLYSIEPALKIIVEKFNFVKLKIISNELPKFNHLKNNQFEFEKWSPEIEFSSIKNSDLGLMPIFDDEFSKGKCSYKMLCYMAGELPVVVSPFGMNYDVLKMGQVGFGATSIDDWVNSIETIIQNEKFKIQFGKTGRRIVLENFDVNVVSNLVLNSFNKVI